MLQHPDKSRRKGHVWGVASRNNVTQATLQHAIRWSFSNERAVPRTCWNCQMWTTSPRMSTSCTSFADSARVPKTGGAAFSLLRARQQEESTAGLR